MTTCPKHPYTPVAALGCLLCEGERLGEADRRAGRRFHKKGRQARLGVARSVEDALNVPTELDPPLPSM